MQCFSHRVITDEVKNTTTTSGGICIRVKICGITNIRDAKIAESYGADAIGVVVFSDSLRSVPIKTADAIFASLGPFTTTVAVTHSTKTDEIDEILKIVPDAIQISNDIPIKGNIRVIRLARPFHPLPLDCDAILVDASMGKGILYDQNFAADIIAGSEVPVILAGGLRPDNVKEAIEKIHPYAVDVATGVESSPGKKDQKLIREFIKNCRETEYE